MTSPAAPAAPAQAARICVFSLLWEPGLGDLVQRNAFLHLLRRAYPAAEITHVMAAGVAARFAEFFASHSYASGVLPGPDFGDPDLAGWERLFDALRGGGYDLALVDPDSWGLLAEHAARCGIGARIGFATGADDDRYLTTPIRLPRPIFGTPDLVDYARGLAGVLGLGVPRVAEVVPPFPYRPEPVPTLPGPVVAVHPGGAPHWNRRWPLDSYAELCRRLAGTVGASFILLGTAEEAPELSSLRQSIHASAPPARVEVSAGDSLNRMASLLGTADVLVANDSAPAHVAAGLGRATVVLYGPTGTEFMWARAYLRHHGVNRRYPCQTVRNLRRGPGNTTMPCEFSCHFPYVSAAGPYPRCLSDITVNEVLRAVRRQLSAFSHA